MMKFRILSFLIALLLSFSIRSAPIDVAVDIPGTVGKYASFLLEGNTPLALEAAIAAYGTGQFAPSNSATLTFSIGSRPVWVRLEVANHRRVEVPRSLSIETSWLDKIDVYFLTGTTPVEHELAGDALAFSERPVDSRFFVFDHRYAPGITTVYIRVQTNDPLVLPIYFSSTQALQARQTGQSYSYGFVYGVILALLLYNLMLYFSLRIAYYLSYAIYLSLFLLANIAYTGHGFMWLWPDLPAVQLWANPLLMVAYASSGLAFAARFLEIKAHFPRLALLIRGSCWGVAGVLVLTVIAHLHTLALLLAFSFVLLFTFAMVVLGALSLYAGNQTAWYFFYASVVAAVSAGITALAVWGFIPDTTYTYRAVEIGTMFEAVLLALALADRFRLIQEQKIRAERMARIDSLTGVNNRRAFYELVDPMWRTGLRNRHAMSVILIDIDLFKGINDNFGHAVGDKVLAHTARVLKQSARGGDILARWGGEEFILFMAETTLAEAVVIAERMREKISAIRFVQGGTAVSFSASFGVAAHAQGFDAFDDLVSNSDRYLYQAKTLGRNRVSSPLAH